MSDVGSLTAIGSAQPGTAIANQALTAVDLGNGLAGLSGFIRFAGTGGTAVTVWLQQSPDDGVTYLDAYCANFTSAGVALFGLTAGAGAALATTDGSLANNTALNSGVMPLFNKWRLKYTSTGTWVNGTLVCEAMPRG